MAVAQGASVNVFDRYRLHIPSELEYFEDGPPGKRVLFITDKTNRFLISFEEGMKLIDLLPDRRDDASKIRYSYRTEGKYVHQKRTIPVYREGIGNFAFFHFELEGDDGKMWYLPGQMTAPSGYEWAESVEPILMELLGGIAACQEKGGGHD